MTKSLLFFLVIYAVVFGGFSAFSESAPETQDPEPVTAQQFYETGLKALAKEDYEKAIPYLEKACEMAPGQAALHNTLGIAYLQQKTNPDAALSAFQEAIRLNPRLTDAYNNLGIVYSGLIEDYALAEEYFREAIKLEPGFSRAYFGLGWLSLVKKKRAEEAVDYFEKVVALSPDYIEAYYYLGIAYIATNHKPKALTPITYLKSKGKEDFAKALEMMMLEEPAVVRSKIFGDDEEDTSGELGANPPSEEAETGSSFVQI